MWVLLAFLAVAAATPSLRSDETAFVPGKQYEYRYVSQVLTGVSVDNKQYAGLKLRCTVVFETSDGTHCTGKINECDILKLNDYIRNYHPTDEIPDSEWTRIQGPEKEVMEREFQKGFKFQMHINKMDHLQCSPDEPYWSVNVKRGLLSFMQLDMAGRNRERVEPAELEILDKLSLGRRDRQSDRFPSTYSVMEEDITGICETVYHISPQEPRDQHFRVTKVRNYDNCQKRPRWKTGFMENVIWGSEYEEKQVTPWQYESEYLCQGTRQQYVIKQAKLTSKQHFNKMELEKGKLLTFTTQWLQLTHSSDSRSPLPVSSRLEQKDSLIMEVPETIIRERQQSQISSSDVRAKVDLMEELLNEAIEMTTPYIKPNATKPLAKINILLRELPMRDIESLINKYCNPSRITPKGEILIDALATCTRPETVPTIVRLVASNVISDARGSYMMAMVGQVGTSCSTLAGNLIQIISHGSQLPSHALQTRRSAVLALGSVAFKLQQKKPTDAGRVAHIEGIIQRIAQELDTQLEQASSLDEKILFLKAMGNAGLPHCINSIRRILHRSSEPEVIRQKAIYALRRLAPYLKSEVQNILMPIYLDMTQPNDLRVAAFIVTLQTKPSFGVLKLISVQLKKEQSLQVGSFVYSYLDGFSKVKDPALRNETKAVTAALKYAKPIRPGILYSKALFLHYYSDFLKSGFITSYEYLNSPQSVLPETFVHRQSWDGFGFPFNGYEFGVEMQGLQTVFKNLVGPKSVLKDVFQGRMSLKDILEPIQHPSPDMLAHIRSMMDKVSMTERDLRNFAASIYFKTFDIETHYFQFDSNKLESVFQYALANAPQLMSELERGLRWKNTKSMPLIDSSYMIPTPCGFPLSLNVTFNVMAACDSSVNVENMPSVRDVLSMVGSSRYSWSGRSQSDQYRKGKNWRQSSGRETKVSINMRPSFVADFNVFVGVECAFLRTGTEVHNKFYVSVPVAGEVKVDLETAKTKYKLHIPRQSEKFVQLVKNTKTCFIKRPVTPSTRDMYIEEKVVRFPTCTRRETFDVRYRIPLIDQDLEVKVDRAVETKKTTLLLPMFARTNLTFIVHPTSEQARELTMETVYLGPDRADRSADLIQDMLDIDSDKDSESDESRDDDRKSDDGWGWWGWNSDHQKSQRSHSSRNPFDPVHTDPSIARPYKHKVVSVIKAHGQRSSQKKIKLQYTNVVSDDLKKCQHNLQVVYTPMYDSSSQEKKIVLSEYTDLQVAKKWLIDGYAPMQSSKDLLSKVELYCGPKDYTQKYIDAELKMGRGAPLSLSRVHTDRTWSQPGYAPIELSLDIDYHSMPRAVQYYGKKIKDFTKALPYITKYVEVESEDARNPPNKLKLVGEFRTNETELELLIMTPSETEIIKNLPIPFLPKRDAVCSLSDVGCFNKWASGDMEMWRDCGSYPVKSFINYVSGGRVPARCELFGQEVHTYDKETIHFPKTDCEVILAKDCSSSVSPSFMVTTEEKNKEEDKKIVHIYEPEHKIKIEPKSGWFEKIIDIDVNGRKQPIPSEGEKYTVYKRDSDPRSGKVCDIKKKGDKVEVYCYKSQIKVITDGIDVIVEAHPSYYGQLCGVCSNYNSEPMDDLMGPRKEMYSRPEEFLLSYIIPSSRCNIDEVRSRLSRGVPRLFAPKDQAGSCEKVVRNAMFEREVRNVRQTCFSIRPVPECRGSCRTPRSTEEKINFYCLPTNDAQCQRLLEKWRRGEILDSIKDKTPNGYKNLRLPDACIPAQSQNQISKPKIDS